MSFFKVKTSFISRLLAFIIVISSFIYTTTGGLVVKADSIGQDPSHITELNEIKNNQVEQPDLKSDLNSINETFKHQDRAKVIIEFKIDQYENESELSKDQIVSQRNKILQKREILSEKIQNLKQNSGKSKIDVKENAIIYNSIPAIALEIPVNTLEELAKDSEIVKITPDYGAKLFLNETINLIGATAASSQGFNGADQTVVIIDSGVDTQHPQLTGKVIDGACFSQNTSTENSLCPGGLAQSFGVESGRNCNVSQFSDCNHGTAVAGVAASSMGVAKGAKIVSIKIGASSRSSFYCDSGSVPCYAIPTSSVLSALDYVNTSLIQKYSLAAVNLSLGFGGFSGSCDNAPGVKTINSIIQNGTAVVAASGNSGSSSSMVWPACVSNVVAVGSSTKSDQISSFTSSTNQLDLIAPGSSIYTTIPGSGYTTVSGTSFAAPHVAGAFAILKQAHPKVSPARLLQALTDTGKPLTISGNGITRSRIQVDAALNLLNEQYDGIPDVMFRNQTDGQIAVWKLNSNGSLKTGYNIQNPGAYWKVAGTGDVDKDGAADIFWRGDGGEISLWLMNYRNEIRKGVNLGNPGNDWVIKAIADFNGDNISDILFRRSSDGQPAIWYLNDQGNYVGLLLSNPGTYWDIVASGQMDDDKVADVVYRGQNGEISLWLLNSDAKIKKGVDLGNPGNDWVIRDVNDMDGDKIEDLIFQSQLSGQPAVWILNKEGNLANGYLVTNPSNYWTLTNVEDVDKDGKGDLLLNSQNGEVAVWIMGGNPNPISGVITGAPGTIWKINSWANFIN